MLLEQIKERRILRDKLLSSLYEYYFNNNGNSYRTTNDEVRNAPGEWLAYQYLQDKRLIHIEKQGQQILLIRLTAYGIDVFEEKFVQTIEEVSQ